MRHPLVIIPVALLASCGPTIRPDFNSAEPAARNSAIVRAASEKDTAAVPDLVRMLDSDDPATRLLAIQALEVITGDRFGYDHAASPADRERAIQKWEQYVAGGSTPPGTAGS